MNPLQVRHDLRIQPQGAFVTFQLTDCRYKTKNNNVGKTERRLQKMAPLQTYAHSQFILKFGPAATKKYSSYHHHSLQSVWSGEVFQYHSRASLFSRAPYRSFVCYQLPSVFPICMQTLRLSLLLLHSVSTPVHSPLLLSAISFLSSLDTILHPSCLLARHYFHFQ